MDLIDKIKALDVSRLISANDQMFVSDNATHYFYVGRSNFLTINNIVNIRKSYPGGNSAIESIFDFGCGHGRVTRYIRAGFPTANIYVTDFDESGVKFCCDNFGCEDTSGTIPESKFDLVFLGSVFTHLPKRIVEPLIERLLKSLRLNGVLIFTSQGRYAIERMRGYDWNNGRVPAWMHYNLDQESFLSIVEQYDKTGYGYVDYSGQKDYGVCIARSQWYSSIALKMDEVIHIAFQEKGSDNHQDVSAFMHASLVDHRKGPLWT